VPPCDDESVDHDTTRNPHTPRNARLYTAVKLFFRAFGAGSSEIRALVGLELPRRLTRYLRVEDGDP